MNMFKKFFMSLAVFASLFLISGGNASALVNSVTPSTNEINITNGWANVVQISKGVGTTDLQFISTRSFYSCFEYRTDGDTSQSTANNFNTLVTDGLYPYTCRINNSTVKTITANEYVEVRMVFGAEADERFDWTRFDVDKALPEPTPTPTPTPNPDVCPNLEGVQTSLPDTYHFDNDGKNCLQFQLGGPPQNGGAGGQVLGASTEGQVLGVSTLANTGSFAQNVYLAIMALGAAITTFGIKNFKKAGK
jgi:hypothetical protein